VEYGIDAASFSIRALRASKWARADSIYEHYADMHLELSGDAPYLALLMRQMPGGIAARCLFS